MYLTLPIKQDIILIYDIGKFRLDLLFGIKSRSILFHMVL